jgi:hypothetical protein
MIAFRRTVVMAAAAVLAAVTPGVTAAAASPTGVVQAVAHHADGPRDDSPPAGGDAAGEPAATSAPVEPLRAPGGDSAAPSTAQVEQYLQFVTGNLDSVWAAWFTASGFPRPETGVHIVGPGESYTTSCADPSGTHPVVTADYNNLFYCSTDTGRAPDGRSAVGSLALPVVTLQRMWSGDILGTQSSVPGDFAAAVAVAHEYGHSVVDKLTTDERRAAPVGKNAELIADCLAGVWTAKVQDQGLLEAGDINEAVAMLQVIGDTGMTDDPHGTSAERVQALRSGLSTGAPTTCTNTYWAG